jgi:DUF2997 family protein
MAESMEIIINLDGTVEITVQGIGGVGCKAVSANLEKALGQVEKDEPTREMTQRAYEPAKQRS